MLGKKIAFMIQIITQNYKIKACKYNAHLKVNSGFCKCVLSGIFRDPVIPHFYGSESAWLPHLLWDDQWDWPLLHHIHTLDTFQFGRTAAQNQALKHHCVLSVIHDISPWEQSNFLYVRLLVFGKSLIRSVTHTLDMITGLGCFSMYYETVMK